MTSLHLALSAGGILALGYLQGCTTLTKLSIFSLDSSVDLKATQNDVYLEIVEWLKACSSLQEVAFNGMISAPDLMTPILLNDAVVLQEVGINAKYDSLYAVKDNHDFHRALAQQTSLQRLYLSADADLTTRDDIEILMNSFCSLHSLKVLHLTRISEYFTDEHILLLAQHMPRLEELSVGGYG